jgi:hypothetical protein
VIAETKSNFLKMSAVRPGTSSEASPSSGKIFAGVVGNCAGIFSIIGAARRVEMAGGGGVCESHLAAEKMEKMPDFIKRTTVVNNLPTSVDMFFSQLTHA